MEKRHLKKVDDNDTFQGAGSSDKSSQNEQETHENDEDPNLRRYERDRNPPSTYEPYFDGKWYVSQIFGVEMGKNMKNTRSLNIIYVNAIFTQLLQT